MLWEVLVAPGEWQDMHEWLKEYNEMERREMDKRRFIVWLMKNDLVPIDVDHSLADGTNVEGRRVRE